MCSASGRLAQHVVGYSPLFVSREQITDAFVAERVAEAVKQAEINKNASDAVANVTPDKLARSFALLEQPYPVEGAKTVAAALDVHTKATKLNGIAVVDMRRMERGEGMDAGEEENYAAEVARLAGLK
eukprot:TRINITY_DN3783_c0_g1_i1.p3 TRINITY_DN3783_c0_g1~~TRINITY_DN3783_c0_g1_i1.p3  ORF type:complete len:128 (-),score=72.96 TRINITY_DN3783_c0_g1_i1:68-451(-)